MKFAYRLVSLLLVDLTWYVVVRRPMCPSTLATLTLCRVILLILLMCRRVRVVCRMILRLMIWCLDSRLLRLVLLM